MLLWTVGSDCLTVLFARVCAAAVHITCTGNCYTMQVYNMQENTRTQHP